MPPYVVNCLHAAGYDTLTTIATINTSKEPGNTLDEIENFIESEYPEVKKFCLAKTSKHCKFLPGHRHLIANFVKDLQPISTLKGERKARKQCKSIRSASKETTEEDDHEVTLDSKLGDIRRQIVRRRRMKC